METINIHNPQNLEITLTEVSQAARQAAGNLVILDDQLLALRLNFGKLRAAIERAFAPIAGAIAPILNSAVRTLTSFCDSVGSVMAALFGTVYKKAVTTTKAAGAALKRTLASFDDIERLNGSGGGGGGTTVTLEPVNDELSPSLQKVVDFLRGVMDKIKQLLTPLKEIDLSPAAEAFGRLGQALLRLGEVIGSALEWAWFNLLVPLGTWTIEELVPASVDALTEALKLLTAVINPLLEGLKQILPALKPIASFIGENLLQFIQSLGQQFQKLTQVFVDKAPQIQAIFSNLAQIISALWEKAEPVLQKMGQSWQSLIDDFAVLTDYLANSLSGDWSMIWGDMGQTLRGSTNGVIGLLNKLMSGLASALNGVAKVLNGWSVTIPDWVPLLGGKQFHFHIGTITAPQIPYLAKGAVLPAGKPFLAMVGDQRHGTNVEAPLSVIQEAVAMTMEDLTRGNMAGHEATVELLQQILGAVLDIRIGDETIASAADRSYSRRAVMKGADYAR